MDRVGDHVLLERLTSLDGRLDASEEAADVLLLAYDPPAGVSPVPRWMHHLIGLLKGHRTPVVVYAPLRAAIVRALADGTVPGVGGVVFSGVDDEDGAEFAALLRESSFRSVTRDIATTVLGADGPWPSELREAIGRLFVAPASFHTVDELARGARMSRRSLERWAARAGLVSLRRLLVVARLAWMYGGLPRARGRTTVLALEAGFNSVTQLRATLRALLGVRGVTEFAALSTRRVRDTLTKALRCSDADA